MAIKLIQTAQSQTNSSSTTSTFASTPKTGNMLVAFAYTNSSAAVLDIPGWTANERSYSGTANTIGIYYKVSDGTENSVTANGNTITRLQISEWSGLLVPAELDGAVNGSTVTVSNAVSTGSTKTTNTHNLILTAGGISASGAITATWSNSFTPLLQDVTAPRLFSAYRITTIAGSYFSVANLNNTNSNSTAMILPLKGAPPIRNGNFMNFF